MVIKAHIDQPIRHPAHADDIAALIYHVRFEKPSLVGYSLAIHKSARYPAWRYAVS